MVSSGPRWESLEEGEAGDVVEGCFGFVPLDAGVFDPEAGVVGLAPVGHFGGVEELDSEVEAAHLVVLLEVPDEFVLEAVGVALLQGARWIVGGRRG